MKMFAGDDPKANAPKGFGAKGAVAAKGVVPIPKGLIAVAPSVLMPLMPLIAFNPNGLSPAAALTIFDNFKVLVIFDFRREKLSSSGSFSTNTKHQLSSDDDHHHNRHQRPQPHD